jgi:ATP-dependent RNA helicase RhlE
MPRTYSMRTTPMGRNGARKRTNNYNNNNRRRSGKYIDPARFVATAKEQSEESYTPQHSFADFELNDLLKNNLAKKGYVTPSPIQDQTIPAGIAGRDVIGMAGTGTGKTAAFALPLLDKLIASRDNAAIIIAPTRELAQQIEAECEALAAGSRLRGALLIGGSSMGAQLRDLRNRPTIVIGTPGRIKDHLERGTLKLEAFNLVVLDEVDRMLDMGFVYDVREILNHTAKQKQIFFFSATMDERVRGLVSGFTSDPVTVAIKSNRASENVHQDVVRYTDNSHRLDQLHELLLKEGVNKAIVFDETQRSVERLSKTLLDRGFSTDSIHGGKTQGQRQRALRKFKNNEVSILVATDVAARGIDVADVTHVINYSTPQEYEDYIHRIGRAGRAGQTGYAYTFVAR